MNEPRSRQIVIAGAGVAGLTAALAFAQRGFAVQLYERASRLEEAGAGVQLSPNATRLLDRLGVLPLLKPSAVRPEAVVLRNASTMAEIARVPLGDAAERRWRAPYLVVHRADLQSALLARAAQEPDINLTLGAAVRDFALHGQGVTVSVDAAGTIKEASGLLFVAADGVWSTIRALAGDKAKSRFIGQLAWRTTVRTDSKAGQAIAALCPGAVVTALLNPGFHLIVYPVRAGVAYNLVAFTKGRDMPAGWIGKADASPLMRALAKAAPQLAGIGEQAGPWTAWPLHVADLDGPWFAPEGLALIGDAAHAMSPFAAQGAAMAIEDAVTLADTVAARPADLPAALLDWEKQRRPRVMKVARRGAFNEFVWHARGPVAAARDMVLRWRKAESLAADLDWLYGWKPPPG